MNDLNIYIILLNTAYLIWLAAFTTKNIIWLRSLTILGNLLVVPYYLYFFENSLWSNIFWGVVFDDQRGDALSDLPGKKAHSTQ